MGKKRSGLGIPHLRVLEALYLSGGLLSRSRLSQEVGKTDTYVGRVVGYTDLERRKKFVEENQIGKSVGTPLRDLGYVVEVELDIDGRKERAFELTEKGRNAYLKERKVLAEFVARKQEKAESQEPESLQTEVEEDYSLAPPD